MDPPHDRRVRQRKPALGHHLHEITKAEFVPQIPAHAEHDDLPVEMAAFEKIVNVQHAWPGSSRANLPPNMRHTHASHQNHKFKGRIRDMTRRTRGFSLQQLIKELKPYIVGWRGYFGFCQTPRVLTNLEAWIRRRLRLYLWRQWRTRQNRFAELRRHGLAKFAAAVAAGSPTGLWRMSGHPAVQQALRNDHFESLGLPRIYAPAQA